MATFLDIPFLQKFSNLFIFLLVIFICYAFLEKTKVFGEEKKGLNALISFFIAILVLFSTKLTAILKLLLPILAVLFIIVIFSFVGLHLFAGEEGAKAITEHKEVVGIFVIIMIIIVIAVVYRVNLTDTEYDEYGNMHELNDSNYNESQLDVNYETGVFNPKLIGLVLVLLIGVFTVRLLAGDNIKRD